MTTRIVSARRALAAATLATVGLASGCHARQPKAPAAPTSTVERAPPSGEMPPAPADPNGPARPALSVEPLRPDEPGSAEDRFIRARRSEALRLLSVLDERPLSEAQTELVQAARGFMRQADDALAVGDLRRARVLVEKAVVLAVDVESGGGR